jgi:hypothetical protein
VSCFKASALHLAGATQDVNSRRLTFGKPAVYVTFTVTSVQWIHFNGKEPTETKREQQGSNGSKSVK